MGTPGYMSPEQVAGRTVDHRSDIFSLGAVLYELLSGRRAFAGDSVAETVSAILKDDPAVPASTDAVSAGVFTLVRHCLAKDAAQRFQSARDLAFALATVVSAGHGRERARAHAPTAIASAGPQRLIVLPFENLSPHGQEEWLAGALADSLTFGLRNVENIIIVNRQHAGVLTDPQQLFETLAVRYCVKGSFQRVGDELKAFVRLIHADTGTVAVQESLTDQFLEPIVPRRDDRDSIRSGIRTGPWRSPRPATHLVSCSVQAPVAGQRVPSDRALCRGSPSPRDRRETRCGVRGCLGAPRQQLCATGIAGDVG